MDMIWVSFVMFCTMVTSTVACSCFPESGMGRFCRYDIIFRGTAIAEYEERDEPIDHSDPFSKYDPNADWVYTVRVDQTIKMPEKLQGAETLSMRTSTQGSMCGTRFPIDVDVVFFAFINFKGEIQTGLCDPNVPWESLGDWEREMLTDHLLDYCANRMEISSTPPPFSSSSSSFPIL